MNSAAAALVVEVVMTSLYCCAWASTAGGLLWIGGSRDGDAREVGETGERGGRIAGTAVGSS